MEVEINLAPLMVKRQQILGSVLRSRPVEEKTSITKQFSHDVLPLLAKGDIEPLIHQVLPLEKAAEAHQIMENSAHFGKIVLIRHDNNLISIYGRVAKVFVKKNEVVTRGQKIGSMAEKANDDTSQTILHFELRRGTQSVNPENYFE